MLTHIVNKGASKNVISPHQRHQAKALSESRTTMLRYATLCDAMRPYISLATENIEIPSGFFLCAAPCQGPLACPHCLARPWPARTLGGHKSLTRHNRASLWTRLSELMSTLMASSSWGLRAHLRLLRIPYLTSTCQEESGDWGEWGG